MDTCLAHSHHSVFAYSLDMIWLLHCVIFQWVLIISSGRSGAREPASDLTLENAVCAHSPINRSWSFSKTSTIMWKCLLWCLLEVKTLSDTCYVLSNTWSPLCPVLRWRVARWRLYPSSSSSSPQEPVTTSSTSPRGTLVGWRGLVFVVILLKIIHWWVFFVCFTVILCHCKHSSFFSQTQR